MWSTPSYDYRHLVTLEETNVVGNVYFSNYVRWQGHCREHFLMERAPGVLRALTDDLALVTVSCGCDYFSELYAADTVELRMTLDVVEDNRVSMAFGYYRVNAAQAELVARGSQTVACMRRGSHGVEPVPVPVELAQALKPYRPLAC
ncbi:acyl-CoA thioesterase [Amycolatopsis palatopharyngis]|uniref:acyl-CoA thioesterase n=1 Tax=Amycolatopsis palatopharyngis TaxID=187982 RepID=UPI0013BEA3FE|nr:acyl-CoA thioesterase [Amycolatopsis palatopharyngis]